MYGRSDPLQLLIILTPPLQDRLLPILANAYALHLAMGSLKAS